MLFGERVYWIDPYESLNSIISNFQSSRFMSWLWWSFDLRNQRHLVDGRLCFDYDLRIPSLEISKTSSIRYDMKSLKMIVWSRSNNLPSIFKEIDSRNELQLKPWLRYWKYHKICSWWFPTHISTKLSDQLRFNN